MGASSLSASMATAIPCPSCAAGNEPGSRFCNQCGAALEATCGACGHRNAPGSRFCSGCGAALVAGISPAPAATASPAAHPITPTRAERRLVSVLFTDLVGFTTFSESRDPEEVRGFLTRYFDRSREIVERFGGTIEKFIGDAVMAVWGTVEARENDAERAVRAGLELVDMVTTLGEEIAVPDLKLRAGVLTGETAVGPGGNESTGMIVGDLVNSASRLQSAAAPGTVYVGETTHRISAGAIRYESVGTIEVKGKAEPITAYRAIRVIAQRGGRGVSEGLEPPFVGRDDEFRLLKDQIHATGRDRAARLVSIVGDPGIGKTRITWELEKYIDGITEAIFWHHGRSPDYGESLTFWALGEMVRQRAGIAETDDPAKSRMKLRTAVARYAPAEEDQRWIEPRLAGLLGLEEMPAGDRGELFAAIRTFFQRIADLGTTVLVFEDLHWADDGLVDFITELVERSNRSPILVITLARPDILQRHPGWGSGRRNTMSMQLAPLTLDAMRALVEGTVPGLPESAVEGVIARSGGVPLYAVEFIRMLISSGDVVRSEDGSFDLVGDLSGLAVPESVQAVIGSRLDRLPPADRSLLQDASVLGVSFTPDALSGVSGQPREHLRERLQVLVRDELLEFEEDPRSPERGQYRFIQGLIREVAYGRLSREDRADRHLKAARHFESLGDLELAAALAAHYVAAYEASGGASDLMDRARQALIDASKRATELHAHGQAINLLNRALEISPADADAAGIQERLSAVALVSGDIDSAVRFGLGAMAIYAGMGDRTGEIRAATKAARAHASAYRMRDAQELLEPLYDPHSTATDAVTLEMELEFARAYMHGDRAKSLEVAERALSRDPGVLAPGTLVDGIINRGNALAGVGRMTEGKALMRGVVHIADELGLQAQAIRALWNLGVFYQFDDLKLAESLLGEVYERARRIGEHTWLLMAGDARALGRIYEGDFAGAEALLDELAELDPPEIFRKQYEFTRTLCRLHQRPAPDDVATARALLSEAVGDEDMISMLHVGLGEIDVLVGDFAAAAARPVVISDLPSLPLPQIHASLALGDAGKMEALADGIMSGLRSPGRYAEAHVTLLRAGAAAARGEVESAASGFRAGIETLERLASAMEVAFARALWFRLVGGSHPEAVAAGEAARSWLESVGADQVLKMIGAGLPAATIPTRAAASS